MSEQFNKEDNRAVFIVGDGYGDGYGDGDGYGYGYGDGRDNSY